MDLSYFHGTPQMVDYTPSAAVDAGDVVIFGDLACIAHLDIAANALGAVAIGGAIYKGVVDGAIGIGKRVYWDAANAKITLTSAGNRPLGTNLIATTADGQTGYILHRPTPSSDLIFAAIAAATAITNTTTETAFDQAVSIPANTLKAGDVIRVRAQAIITAQNSTDTLDLQLRLGTTDVLVTGAVDVATNDIGYIEADIVIRTIGAGGTMVAAGVVALGVPGTVTAKPKLLASTAIDTTAAISVNVSATWSVANAGNSVRLDILNVQILRK